MKKKIQKREDFTVIYHSFEFYYSINIKMPYDNNSIHSKREMTKGLVISSLYQSSSNEKPIGIPNSYVR